MINDELVEPIHTQCPLEADLVLKHDLLKCKEEVDNDLSLTRNELIQLRAEVHELRTDVHGIRDGVNNASKSLEVIADSMSKLTDFPEVWNKVKGFWSVLGWIRTNILTLLLLGAIIAVALYFSLKGVLPI